jgi:hydrogenase/urease accessory protein HupE
MRSGCRTRLAFALCLVVLSVLVVGARAHNTDTSYARIRVFDDRLEVRLTCDVFTLSKIVPDLDANQDLALSREELRRAAPEIRKFFASRVGMEVNGVLVKLTGELEPFWPLDAPDPLPAKLWHVNEALISFPFDIPLSTPAKDVALLFDVFSIFGERHAVLGVFEYRGQPTEVVFTQVEPDYLFQTLAGAPATPDTQTPPAPAGTPQRSNVGDSPAWRFFKMGIEHILTGYDHLCFLLALLVVGRLRPLIAIITSFTIAHSITLLIAAFGIVTVPTRLIECGIALTIVYVAVENLWRSDYSHRWRLTFFFGLIHGFGFANTLDPQQLPIEAKARCLLVFNLGVEVAQLAVVLALLPLSVALAKWNHGTQAKAAVSIVVALLGLAWFLDRAFALRWMPF